jgi:hypothetical protein
VQRRERKRERERERAEGCNELSLFLRGTEWSWRVGFVGNENTGRLVEACWSSSSGRSIVLISRSP